MPSKEILRVHWARMMKKMVERINHQMEVREEKMKGKRERERSGLDCWGNRAEGSRRCPRKNRQSIRYQMPRATSVSLEECLCQKP